MAASVPAAEPRVPRGVLPMVWLLAMVWMALETIGRGLGRFHDWYERGASVLGRACLRATRAVLRSLGPLGRTLVRLTAPALRALRRVWDWLGLRVFLFLVRGLGRAGRWLLARARPAFDRVIRWARGVAAWASPVLRTLAAWTRAVERATARLGALLRRTWAPVARAVRTIGAGWTARDR